MLDFAKTLTPSGAHLGARQKCSLCGIVDLWAKFGAFGRIWTKQSLYSPDYYTFKPHCIQCTLTNNRTQLIQLILLWKNQLTIQDIDMCKSASRGMKYNGISTMQYTSLLHGMYISCCKLVVKKAQLWIIFSPSFDLIVS